jgi:hypothetical protein
VILHQLGDQAAAVGARVDVADDAGGSAGIEALLDEQRDGRFVEAGLG